MLVAAAASAEVWHETPLRRLRPPMRQEKAQQPQCHCECHLFQHPRLRPLAISLERSFAASDLLRLGEGLC